MVNAVTQRAAGRNIGGWFIWCGLIIALLGLGLMVLVLVTDPDSGEVFLGTWGFALGACIATVAIVLRKGRLANLRREAIRCALAMVATMFLVTLIAQSYFAGPGITVFRADNTMFFVWLENGVFTTCDSSMTSTNAVPGYRRPRFDWVRPSSTGFLQSLKRFGVASEPTRTFVRAPIWPLALLTGTLAWWWHPRQTQRGTCSRCGYDLRASRERCPECGEQTA